MMDAAYNYPHPSSGLMLNLCYVIALFQIVLQMSQRYSTNRGSHGPTGLSNVENAEYSATSSSEVSESTTRYQRSDAPSPSSHRNSRNTAQSEEQPYINGHEGESQEFFDGLQNGWRSSNPGTDSGEDRSSEYDAGDEQHDNGGAMGGEGTSRVNGRARESATAKGQENRYDDSDDEQSKDEDTTVMQVDEQGTGSVAIPSIETTDDQQDEDIDSEEGRSGQVTAQYAVTPSSLRRRREDYEDDGTAASKRRRL